MIAARLSVIEAKLIETVSRPKSTIEGIKETNFSHWLRAYRKPFPRILRWGPAQLKLISAQFSTIDFSWFGTKDRNGKASVLTASLSISRVGASTIEHILMTPIRPSTLKGGTFPYTWLVLIIREVLFQNFVVGFRGRAHRAHRTITYVDYNSA